MSDREGLTFTFRDGTTTKDVIAWAKKFEEKDYRIVAYDIVGTKCVSTIWQGMPSVFGEPNNYETAVFEGVPPHAVLLWQKRWHTEEMAIAGHAMALLTVEQGQVPVED